MKSAEAIWDSVTDEDDECPCDKGYEMPATIYQFLLMLCDQGEACRCPEQYLCLRKSE